MIRYHIVDHDWYESWYFSETNQYIYFIPSQRVVVFGPWPMEFDYIELNWNKHNWHPATENQLHILIMMLFTEKTIMAKASKN